MEPQEAKIIADFLLRQIEEEHATTRKVLAALPADKPDYAPDPRSTGALKLAWHVASSEVFFLNSIADGQFKMEGGELPPEVKTPANVLAWYEANFPPAIAKLKALNGEQLARVLDFAGAFQLPAVVYLSWALVHLVHHRGQLSTYIRPMGGKVPSIYGGSADEPWQPPA